MGRFKITINEMKESPNEFSTYDFNGNGTYSALWAANVNTYPDNSILQILDKYKLGQIHTLNDAHVTLIFSKDLITPEQYNLVKEQLQLISEDGLTVNVQDVIVFANSDGTHLVAKLENHPDLLKINRMYQEFGLATTYLDYIPHVILFTTKEVITPSYFNNVIVELKSLLKAKPIVFSRWNITNINDGFC